MKKVGPYFILGILFSAPSAYGLFRLVTETRPYLRERWLFFGLVFFLVCGITLPFFALMNRYFFTQKRIDPPTVVRESLGCGLIADLLIWFRMGRVLSTPIVFVLVGGLTVVEVFLRARETVAFRSGLDDEE